MHEGMPPKLPKSSLESKERFSAQAFLDSLQKSFQEDRTRIKFADFVYGMGIGYETSLETEFLNGGKNAMKAKLLEDFGRDAGRRGSEGQREIYLHILES